MILVKLISSKVLLSNVQEILTFSFIEHFCYSVSCPKQKTLTSRDLNNGGDLNNPPLWDDKSICVDVFKLVCSGRRNFRSSPEALQKKLFTY